MSDDVVRASEDVLARHARSFRLASWFLPPACRADAAVCYALCRLADDLADEATDADAARAALAQLDAELTGDAPARPLVAAWRAMAARCDIPVRAARDLVAGVRSDLDAVRVPDDAALLQYCYRVAGTVGIMMCGVVGVRAPHALPHAVDLGVAMQLTNIARDVAEDAGLGRVYLPRTRLEAHGTSPEALLAQAASRDAVAAVVRELLAMAERYYASADAGMRYIPARARLAIYAAGRLYRGIGRKLLSRGADALAGRTMLTAWDKLWQLGAALTSFAVGAPRAAHDATLHTSLRGLPGAHAESP